MTRVRVGMVLGFTVALAAGMSCGGEETLPPAALTAADTAPKLRDIELPVSLRTRDAAPGDARTVEVTRDVLRVDGEPVLTLERGRVAAADRAQDVIPKLDARLQSPARGGLALRVQANLPYETLALILSTARKIGMSHAHLQVRAPGATEASGWLAFRNYVMASKADDLPPITALPAKPWSAFTDHWREAFDGCRSGQGGDCAPPGNAALGGTLKVELMASGRGVNVDFYRRGLTPAQEAKEDRQRARILATKKEDFLQGRLSRDELVETLLLGDPSTYALFQFRYQEALKGPSALAKTIEPVCHREACGVVVSADLITPLVNVVSMVGAAFPDGTPSPAVAFEMPWTERPKPAVLSEWIAQQRAR